MNDLPDVSQLFSKEDKSKEELNVLDCSINVQFSKEPNSWIDCQFIDTAIGGIGLHILLPLMIDLSTEELNKIKIRFLSKDNKGKIEILKTLPAKVRWQEPDNATGNLKIGIHFSSEHNEDEQLKSLLLQLKESKK